MIERCFLTEKYPNLHTSREVKSAVLRHETRTQEKIPNDPDARIDIYLDRLEEIYKSENSLKIYKEKFLYPEFLIDQNNIPESYFGLQKKIAKERGEGRIEFTQEDRRKEGEVLYNDQKKSLDNWVDYLIGNNDYPTWFKYYAIKNVVKMGIYDKEKKEFRKRAKETTTIFPDLNREALSLTYDVLQKHYLKHEEVDDEELKRIIDKASFPKIYAYEVDKVTPVLEENKEKVSGEWVRYRQFSDPAVLCESLKGFGTGWCTAGEETAKKHLGLGDFYVYYSKGQNSQNTIPRIAIRMESREVAEVRGIEGGQNLEGNMIDIAKEKYSQLLGGEKFDKKSNDMKILTLIDKKNINNQNLTIEDLRFLYEVDDKIEGFGYEKDSRVKEILENRSIKSDLSLVFNCTEDQIGITKNEIFKEGLKLYYGDLSFSDPKLIEDFIFPENIVGNISFSNVSTVKNMILPKILNGNLYFSCLNNADNLVLPEVINGSLYLSGLESIDSLKLPEAINGDLYFMNLKSAKNIVFPKMVNGNFNLYYFKSAENVILPKMINGDLNLSSLKSINGLELPEMVCGTIFIASLNSEEKTLIKNKYPKLKSI